MQWKSVHILEGDNLVVFYYFSASEILPDKRGGIVMIWYKSINYVWCSRGVYPSLEEVVVFRSKTIRSKTIRSKTIRSKTIKFVFAASVLS